MKRRTFFKQSALASTALFVPSFLKAFDPGKLFSSRSGKVLVVIQLSGGNDGLNTFIPYRNDLYYQNRPSLGIKGNEILKLSDEMGMNPGMAGLRELWEDGLISVVNSVGYPNPDRSHFRSMDIWQTASDSDTYLSTGWLGRYLDNNCEGCVNPHHILEIDDSLSLALKGENRNGFAMSDPQRLAKTTRNPLLGALGRQGHSYTDEEPAAYLYKVMIDTQQSAEYLSRQAREVSSTGDYPQTPFGRDLKKVAGLILADTDTKIYYLTLSGFDTHANQKGIHQRLLQQYADGMNAFVKELKKQNLLDDTLILTFSEFGRRVKQNGSGGTDHGTANNVILMGGKLRKPGFFNVAPDLSRLDQGDLIFDMDFRRIYREVLENWLESDPRAVLGGDFSKPGILV